MLRRWIPSYEQAPREKTRPRSETKGAAQDDVGGVIDLDAINKIRAIQGRNGTSLFERVVAQFADTAPSLAAALRAQCKADDAETLRRTAHSLKSSAAALGAGQLARRCAQIETFEAKDLASAVPGRHRALLSLSKGRILCGEAFFWTPALQV
ncbi:MAG TPA: Hpt domain-containing protein [Stellaceae bacterium]|nr:Hpt domain-containing protein [Stellaceae bacterium]